MGRKSATVMDAQTKSVEAEIKPVEDSAEHPNGEFILILSKDNLDRDEENLWADEWLHPLPHKIHMDTDHAFAKGLSVPHTAGSGVPELTDDGDLLVKGTYAGTPHGQLTRQLVKEGHIWQASVSYQTHMAEDGRLVRELLNGTFTGVPANPEAVVLMSKESKAKPTAGRFADPGYQTDKQPRYPIDTEKEVRAALSYFGQKKNRDLYSAKEQAAILGRIKSRARALGIQVSDDSKAMLWALTKAITTKFGGTLEDLTQTTPARTLANTDVGAASVYDGGDDDNDDDDGDTDWASGDDLIQALHDAACALGAACDDDDMKTISTFAASLKAAAAGSHQLNNYVTSPVSRGWDFVVAGPPGEQMYTLTQDGEVFGSGKVDDLKTVKDESVKAKSSEADGEDDKDEGDSSEDTDDEEKSDSSDTKAVSYELTLADGNTITIDGSMLKAVETKRAVGEGETIPNIAEKDAYDPSDNNPEKSETSNANTEPPEHSAGTSEAEHPIDAQSVAASGARTDEIAGTVEADSAEQKSVTTDTQALPESADEKTAAADAKSAAAAVSPADVAARAAKARLRKFQVINGIESETA